MQTNGLDKIDIMILDSLQTNAAITSAELGEQINLSQNACWRRIKRLEDEGYILSRVARLSAEKLGAGLTVFVSIKAAEHSEQWLRGFASAVNQMNEVVEFYRMSGEVDYLLKLRVRDIRAYDDVYKKLISKVRLTDVCSTFAMEEMKYTTCLPLPSA